MRWIRSGAGVSVLPSRRLMMYRAWSIRAPSSAIDRCKARSVRPRSIRPRRLGPAAPYLGTPWPAGRCSVGFAVSKDERARQPVRLPCSVTTAMLLIFQTNLQVDVLCSLVCDQGRMLDDADSSAYELVELAEAAVRAHRHNDGDGRETVALAEHLQLDSGDRYAEMHACHDEA